MPGFIYTLLHAAKKSGKDAIINFFIFSLYTAHPADSSLCSPHVRRELRVSHLFLPTIVSHALRVQIAGRGHNKFKPSLRDTLNLLAHPARFERAIPAFGGRCSIQLSHGCVCHGLLYCFYCEMQALIIVSCRGFWLLYECILRVFHPFLGR